MLHSPHFTISRYIVLLGIAWTLALTLLATWDINEEAKNTRNTAIIQARAYFNKDQALRLWATQHGRIYVPVSSHYPPDEHMAHIPERDISTPSGIRLTLINPARIIRDLDESYGYLYGVTGRVTSLKPLAPENTPDAWEKTALQALFSGNPEVLAFTREGENEYLRLMQPLVVNAGCLLCHFDQNFEIGKPGGGISIKLPMKNLRQQENANVHTKLYTLLGVWLIGLLGLAISNYLYRRQEAGKRTALQQLQRSEQRKSAIMDTALDCIISIDGNDRIQEFNAASENTFGYKKEAVIGKQLAKLLVPESLRKQHCQALSRQIETGQSKILGTRIETTALHADGHEFPIELAVARIDLDNETLFTAYLRDITGKREMEEKLRYQASRDDLTGVLNRHTFEMSLKRACQEIPQDTVHCLCYIDLDRFKIINDSCGHSAGDELLRQIPGLLQTGVTQNAILGRLGGDEFGLLIQNCSSKDARMVGNSLLDTVAQFRFYWDDKIFSLGLSIGLVLISEPQQNVSDLLSRADAACYRAKEEGRNRYYIDEKDNLSLLQQRRGEIDWVNRIQAAFENDQVALYQQPIYNIQSSPPYCHAIEILFRLIDENGEIITPEHFMPAAERYNLMPTIDRWVIRRTCEWLKQYPGTPPLVTINLSGDSIVDPFFLEFILEQLQQQNIEAGNICLEITETVAITNLSKARKFISTLHDFGCLFALDDFGSGMSSYGYLKDLPVDLLKIDGQFVIHADQDPISLAMVKSINEIGQLMGKKTIAEFVESKIVLETMQALGVDYAQGYYFNRPEPLHINPCGNDHIQSLRG